MKNEHVNEKEIYSEPEAAEPEAAALEAAEPEAAEPEAAALEAAEPEAAALEAAEPETSSNRRHFKDSPERMFSQKEVENIVKKRLAREKDNYAALEATMKEKETLLNGIEEREAILYAREQKFECKQYLSEKGYSAELLDAIPTENAENFKHSIDIIAACFGANPHRSAPPLASMENNTGGNYNETQIKKAFLEKSEHEPRYRSDNSYYKPN